MTRALFVCTPAESKRLIGKAVARMEEVQYALKQSNILISHGSTNIYVLEEILGKERLSKLMNPSTYVTGIIKRGVLCATTGKKRTPIVLKNGSLAPYMAASWSKYKLKLFTILSQVCRLYADIPH